MSDPSPVLESIALGDPPGRWAALGLIVGAGGCWAGQTWLALGAPGAGITGWRWSGVAGPRLAAGLPPSESAPPPGAAPVGEHPLGVRALDHLVAITADFPSTVAELAAAGLTLKRVRETPDGARQGFYRVGQPLLELVETPGLDGPPRLWGLTLTVADLDTAAADLGPLLGGVRDAVQPGRRIATVRRVAGLGQPVALISPAG